MMRIAVISLTIVFCLVIGYANAQNISDEARRYFDRGRAAVEMAKTPADYKDAIKEFKQAATLAPDWPNVYYNLGLIQEKVGKRANAIRNLAKYLELSPNSNDSREVKKFIAKIEYKMEKTEGIKQNFLHIQKYKLEKQFKTVFAKINSTSANHNIDKLVCEQNELFVKIMNTSTMTYAEKSKYKLNLPVSSKTTVSDYYKDAKTLISTSKDFFQGNLYFNIEVNPNAGTKGLINITHRETVQVSGEDNAQRISNGIDFIVGKIRLPRASFAVEGGRKYSNIVYNALDRFMNDAMVAVRGHRDSKKFWKEYYNSLSPGQKIILNWIKFKK